MAGQGQSLPASHAMYIPIETIESRRRPTNPTTPLKEDVDDDLTFVHIFCYIVALFSTAYIIGSHVHMYINTCNPEVHVKSLSIAHFDIKQSIMNMGANVVFDVKNPSHGTKLLWQNSVVSVSYDHQFLGSTVMNSFFQNAKDETLVVANISSSRVTLDDWMVRGMQMERANNGALDFDVNMEGRMWCGKGQGDGDVDNFNWVTVNCLVRVEFPVNATVGTSASGLWPCFVKTKKQGVLQGL